MKKTEFNFVRKSNKAAPPIWENAAMNNDVQNNNANALALD
jgi:hypothetical protein